MTTSSVTPAETSFPKGEIKVLLLENVHESAHEIFRGRASTSRRSAALKEDELVAKLGDVHILGIRSKTHVTDRALRASRLLSVGAFCIGTNQIELERAMRSAACPSSTRRSRNTRSVAELVIAEIVMLSRQLGDRSHEMHQGNVAQGRDGLARGARQDARHRRLRPHRHAGRRPRRGASACASSSTTSRPKLPLGNTRRSRRSTTLLAESDFVTLHVPETPQTKSMIGDRASSPR